MISFKSMVHYAIYFWEERTLLGIHINKSKNMLHSMYTWKTQNISTATLWGPGCWRGTQKGKRDLNKCVSDILLLQMTPKHTVTLTSCQVGCRDPGGSPPEEGAWTWNFSASLWTNLCPGRTVFLLLPDQTGSLYKRNHQLSSTFLLAPSFFYNE